MLKYCTLSSATIFDVFLLFAISLETRLQLDLYINRFYSEDLVHKILFLLQFFGVFTMILNMAETSNHGSNECNYSNDYTIGLATGFLVTRLSLIIMYALTMYYHESAYVQLKYLIVSLFLTSFLALVMMFTPSSFTSDDNSSHEASNSTHSTSPSFVLSASSSSSNDDSDSVFGNSNATVCWSFIFIIEIVGWIASCIEMKIPIHVDDCRVRVGTFVMIVMGESIIQLIYQILDIDIIYRHYEFGFLGLLMIFAFALQYFDASPHEMANHALSNNSIRGLFWFLMTIPLCFSIFLVGASLKLLLYDLINDHVSVGYCKLLSWSAFATVCQLNILRMLHKGVDLQIIIAKPKRSLSYAVRFIVAFSHAFVIRIPNSMDSAVSFLFYNCLIACLSCGVDIFVHSRKRLIQVLSKSINRRLSSPILMDKEIPVKRDDGSEGSTEDKEKPFLTRSEFNEGDGRDEFEVSTWSNVSRLSTMEARHVAASQVIKIIVGGEGELALGEVRVNEDHPISYNLDDEDDDYDPIIHNETVAI